jgi:hypothetical protein
MEHVLVICLGCGAKIRTPMPERAASKTCPRCKISLAESVASIIAANASGLEPFPEPMPVPVLRSGLEVEVASATSLLNPPNKSETPRAVRTLTALALLLTAVALGIAAWRGVVPAEFDPRVIEARNPLPNFGCPVEALGVAESERPKPSADVIVPSVADSDIPLVSAGSQAPTTTAPSATIKPATSDSVGQTPASTPADPVAAMKLAPPVAAEPRYKVHDETGREVVVREHGRNGDRVITLLPDGQLGYPTRLIPTEDPFLPLTMKELKERLETSVYRGYRIYESNHYLIFAMCSDNFARGSRTLLENLYGKLTVALKERGFEVHDSEFPLVAVIFATEREFRAHRDVAADVQAYYEIDSNRIFFYELADRGEDTLTVALRKPQTVAHEGTHQILSNVGVQPRLAPWPLWLIEGFAEFCSPATTTKKNTVDWAGLGRINALHMATIHDIFDQPALQFDGFDHPPPARDANRAFIQPLVRSVDLNPTDYALSWALVHYLANKRKAEFWAYLKIMSKLEPLSTRSPDQHWTDFRLAFPGDPRKLEKSMLSYLSKIKFAAPTYYLVIFAQPIPGNMIRRAAMVSQSPSAIEEWIQRIRSADGGEAQWQLMPHPTSTSAAQAAEAWMRDGQ